MVLVGSPRLATYAEAELAGTPVSDKEIATEIAPCFVDKDGRGTDTVVLACTHYPLLTTRFKAVAPWPVDWIDPAPAIARRVADLLHERPAAPLRRRRRSPSPPAALPRRRWQKPLPAMALSPPASRFDSAAPTP